MSIKGLYTLIACLLSSTIVSSMLLVSSYSFATDSTDVVDQINITVPVSCSLTGTNLLHTTTIQNNQYKTDIGSATIKATCNDTNGLAIYAIGYTNEEDGNNKMHSSTLDSSYDIVTGKYVSGTTTNSVWSMKLAPVSGTYVPTIRNDATYNYTNYELIPSTYTKVAYRTTATDIGTGALGANFTTNYAVYASATQPAGTYTGKVKFTLVHPQNEVPAQPVACQANKICYNPNTALVEGQMGKQSLSSSQLTDGIPLWAPNFKRTGYGFAGWNTAYDYSGTTYGPNETITAPSDISTKGLSLYAVWVPSAGILQNWNGCRGMEIGDVTALTDSRDNNTYAVARLKDYKCWMIENLRLDDSVMLSSSNTHNPSLPLTNIYDTNSTSNHLSPTSSLAYNATTAPEGWCTIDSTACDDQSRLQTDNTIFFTNNTSSNYYAGGNVYSYGNYYNWYSATAGYGKYGDNYGTGYHAPGDICPSGWHLPKGGEKSQESTNEFWELIVTRLNNGVEPANYDSSPLPYYGEDESSLLSNKLRTYPNNFVLSGFYNSGSYNNRNSYGNYSSVSGYNSGSSRGANYMSLGRTSVNPGTNFNAKSLGWTVRCIVDFNPPS